MCCRNSLQEKQDLCSLCQSVTSLNCFFPVNLHTSSSCFVIMSILVSVRGNFAHHLLIFPLYFHFFFSQLVCISNHPLLPAAFLFTAVFAWEVEGKFFSMCETKFWLALFATPILPVWGGKSSLKLCPSAFYLLLESLPEVVCVLHNLSPRAS